MMIAFFISTLLLLPILTNTEDISSDCNNNVGIKKECLTKSILNSVGGTFLDEFRNILPSADTLTGVTGRGKKKHKLGKYLLPLLVGFLLIKSILLPIALKALAVLSGKAVILSLMSLILAAIVGLKKISHSGDKSVDIVTVPLSKYRRKDMFYDWEEAESEDPYGYYRDRPIDIPRKTRYDKNQ